MPAVRQDAREAELTPEAACPTTEVPTAQPVALEPRGAHSNF